MKFTSLSFMALALSLVGCSEPAPPPAAPYKAVVEAAPPQVTFREVAAAAGIDFRHINGAVGNKWMPETMGGGVAVFDYNNDGRNDLLFVSGTEWDEATRGDVSSLVLYENLGNSEGGVPQFRDVTEQAALFRQIYAMGATVGDFDNDGWRDIYVSGLSEYGGNRLLRNVSGKFVDVSGEAGVDVPGWGTSSAFFDYDADGRLDLLVCRYVEWTPKDDLFCSLDGENKSYCTPERYSATSSVLFHNLGEGRFADVSHQAGIDNGRAKALGVAPWDFDGDGRIDFAVANDTTPNNLFRNNGDGTFTDVALEAGIAVNESGKSRGAMGMDWADALNGGSTLAIGNFSNELKSFYWTDKGEVFLDQSASSGIGRNSLLALTFGVFFFDYDLDGRADLLFANGHVENSIQSVQSAVTFKQAPTLYWNNGNGKMSDATRSVGPDFPQPMVARGSAFGDLDGDGDLDVVMVESGGPARVFLNELDHPAAQSLRLDFVGDGLQVSRDAIGTRVHVQVGDKSWTDQVRNARSYASASEPTMTVGLGQNPNATRIEVTWPDGTQEQVLQTPAGHYRWRYGQGLEAAMDSKTTP
ncbi:MAG: CRTAC1 family protein [Chitinophagaceae bacterium]